MALIYGCVILVDEMQKQMGGNNKYIYLNPIAAGRLVNSWSP